MTIAGIQSVYQRAHDLGPLDLVIVDEAHASVNDDTGRAGSGRTQRYELVRALADDPQRHLILVTATPHSGNEGAFRNLIALLDVLALSFEDEGYDVLCAYDGEEGWLRVKNDHPDVIVSDVNMPRLDGFSLCRRLRDEGYALPFILLTSRDNEIDEALGLDFGADDYVAKPFSTRVLVARVKALLRRQKARAGDADDDKTPPRLVQEGRLSLDADRLEVRFGDEPITVTVTEFRMLEAFATRPGIVLSRDRLLELVRGDDSIVADRIIDTYVRRLRRKLEHVDPAFDQIETVIGAGYRWKKSE